MPSIYQLSNTVLPFFAPWPRALLLHALELHKSYSYSAFLQLHASLREARRETFEDFAPALKDGTWSTSYLIQKLTEFTPGKTLKKNSPLSAETLSHWRKAGLLRYRAKNTPDHHSGAALLTLRRMVGNRERRWLPSYRNTSFVQEPLWWCWKQESLSSPILPCAVPLPDDLPSSALLWTEWQGAAWDPGWLSVGNLGCCRWAGSKEESQFPGLLWDITLDDLISRWSVQFLDNFYGQALQATPLTLQTLATLALLQRGTEQLSQLQNTPLPESSISSTERSALSFT